MLQDFRDNLRGVTATILVAIIIVPFAFWGVESLFVSGTAVTTAVSVDDDKIAEVEVLRGIELQKQKILTQFSDVDPATLDDALLREPVVKQLIREHLLAATAAKQGMAVSDNTFNEILLSTDVFKSEGKFDRAQYEYQISRLGYTPLEYRNVVKREMLANQFSVGVQASAPVTQAQIDSFSNLVLQTRSFRFATLPLATFAINVEVDDEEVAAYYADHGGEFQEPDKVVVEYIELTADNLASQVEVTDAMLRERFDEEQASGATGGASWHLAHILLEDKEGKEKVIAEVEQKLAAGEEFSNLAKTYSSDFGSAEAGGDLGTFTVDSLPEGFAEGIADLAVGQVSAPIKSGSGVHLVKVVDKTEGEALEFDTEKLRLEAELRASKAAELMAGYVEKLKDETYSVDSLAPAAEKLGLTVSISEPFAETGGEGIARFPAVVKAAFSEDVREHGYPSDVLELGDQHYVVIHRKQDIPAHQAPLAAVKEQIVTTLKSQHAKADIAKAADDMVAKVQSGESLESLAELQNVEVTKLDDATRFDPRAAPEVLAALFSESSTTLPVVGQVISAAGDISVYVLAAVKQGDSKNLPGEEQKALRASLQQMMAVREYMAYLNSLEAGADISRH